MWTYADDLRWLAQNDELSFYTPPLPPILGQKVARLFNKITLLAAKIERIDSDLKLDFSGKLTAENNVASIAIDASIKAALDECETLIDELDAAIVERDRLFSV
jgi:hypothetical protein